MESIDREKFGAFVAARRKELGLTQQELADKLFVSNKAVSKWETGQSLPDIGLLEPLAQCLGVSVAELLRGERIRERPLEPEETEELVDRAIAFGEKDSKSRRWRWRVGWLISALLAAAGVRVLLLQYRWDELSANLLAVELLCLIFGFWAVFFAPTQLPRYYDENKITTFSQGPFRMNLAGVRINNGNWPHILSALRWWTVTVPAVFPPVYGALRALTHQWGSAWELGMTLTACLGLLVPVIVVAKIYE